MSNDKNSTNNDDYEASRNRKNDQIAEIKSKLQMLVEKDPDSEHPYKYYKKLMNHEGSLFFNIGSLKSTLSADEDSDKCNMCVIITLCRYYNIDISSLLSPPEKGVLELTPTDPLISSGHFINLNNVGYNGNYYGYMFSRYKNRKSVIEFKLTMNIDKTPAEATLKYNETKTPRILTGTPKLITKSRIIYIIFTNQNGEFSEFFMPYKHLGDGSTLWFNRGIIVTNESATDTPGIWNFIISDKEIQKDKQQYIPGLLMMSGSVFLISEEQITKLKDSNLINEFLEKCGNHLKNNKHNMYSINERSIMEDIEELDNSEKFQLLSQFLLIKEKAELPRFIQFPNNTDYSDLSNKYLTTPMDND